jgi:DNA-binding PadR family transcriptional regulator
MLIDDEILELILQQPGITGAGIARALASRSWAGRFFGPRSFWSLVFSPNSEKIYPALRRLEQAGHIRGEWGLQVNDRPRRRHYYL